MGANSTIEWTTHTFNPWWGCTNVSPACDHCYAELLAKRRGFRVWGPGAFIRQLSDAHWREPLKWNERATRASDRPRVFCASMADVFEGRPEQAPLRERLWKIVVATPNLDWLLLTKRPGKIAELVPWQEAWPRNVWVGTTAENQEWTDKRLPHLLALPAIVRFVSVEPLLGPVDLSTFLHGERRIDWVIVGGESGAAARPMNAGWVRAVRDQCVAAGVPLHFKQWGTFGPRNGSDGLVRLGKKSAGRSLDGRTWDQLPNREGGIAVPPTSHESETHRPEAHHG